MTKGRVLIGMRGSICSSAFIVGAGAPGGVSEPCGNADRPVRSRTRKEVIVFIGGGSRSNENRRACQSCIRAAAEVTQTGSAEAGISSNGRERRVLVAL